MVDHFMDGTGTAYRNKTLTKKVREHKSVKKYVSEGQENTQEATEKI